MDDELLGILANGTAVVTFKKVSDDSIRVMSCTLCESLIPPEQLPTGAGRPKHEGVVSVFALDVNAWRSFRRDSVISYADGLVGVELN
jgi:hypothetical protein